MKAPEPGDEQSSPRPAAEDARPPDVPPPAQDSTDAGSVLARFRTTPRPPPPPPMDLPPLPPDRDELMDSAADSGRRGEWVEVIAQLRELTTHYIHDSDGWALMGLAHLARGEGEEARRCLIESLELEDTEEGYVGLGWAYVICSEPYWARATFKSLMEITPDSHRGMVGRAIVEVLLGNRLTALAAAEHLEVIGREEDATLIMRELLAKDDPRRSMEELAAKIAAELAHRF